MPPTVRTARPRGAVAALAALSAALLTLVGCAAVYFSCGAPPRVSLSLPASPQTSFAPLPRGTVVRTVGGKRTSDQQRGRGRCV